MNKVRPHYEAGHLTAKCKSMKNLFECRIKYQKVDDDGKFKKVSETYLVDAVSFTEAEARITKEMEAYISGEFSVVGAKPVNYSDVFVGNGGTMFKAKIQYVSLDDVSGSVKQISDHILVEADNVKAAFETIEKNLSTMMVDYTIHSITRSPVLEFFPYFDKDQEPEPDGKQRAYVD